METEEEIMIKERRQEIDAAFNRLMRIKRIRMRKKLKKWLKYHTN